METSVMLHQADNLKNKEKSVKKCGNKLLKFLMLAFVLFSITLLSSCFVVTPGMETRKGAHYGHDNRNNHAGQHDNGEHRGHHK